jgi:excisionase family DNA binding protein
MEILLTTQEAAERAGVGPTAIKRWADSGLLPCVKTAGGHRRFREHELLAFLSGQTAGEELVQAEQVELNAWIKRLLDAESGQEVEAQLLRLRGREGAWYRAAPFIGVVLTEIGVRWESGELSVIQEHFMSERLLRAITRISEALPVGPDAAMCLLTVVPGDDHVLGLALVELCLREAGLRTRWAGTNTPVADLEEFIADSRAELLAVSASRASTDKRALDRWARTIATACEAHNVHLLFGGEGSWPQAPHFGTRLRSFDELHAYLAGMQPRALRRGV